MTDLIGTDTRKSAITGSGTHSLWCSNEEWAAWTETATAMAMSLSAWARGWLNEAIRYDRLQLREKNEQGQQTLRPL
jgi:hypothetical protein